MSGCTILIIKMTSRLRNPDAFLIDGGSTFSTQYISQPYYDITSVVHFPLFICEFQLRIFGKHRKNSFLSIYFIFFLFHYI